MPELGDYATGWGSDAMPKIEGDKVIGTVTELSMGNSEYGAYPIVSLKLTEKVSNQKVGTEVAIHCFHTALRSQIEDLKPVPGETLGVMYSGKREAKDGKRTYEHYAAKILAGRTQESFWDTGESNTPARPSAPTDVPWEDDEPGF